MSNHVHLDAPRAASEVPHDLVKQIIFQIRRLTQAKELYTKELNKKYQVSASQLNSLIALYEQGSLPPSQIARHIMVKSSTVTGIIDRLEQKGLVTRSRTSPDRRVITVELTESGRTLAENAPPPIQQKVVEGLERLPQSEMEKIVLGLNMLTQMLDVQDLEVE
ncbi:MAG: MarR family transcriptional regulator [Deltaproteobacteria bacterium]|nr:MarR family transcriptional regulator [Deltaproteobacteria bacterium]